MAASAVKGDATLARRLQAMSDREIARLLRKRRSALRRTPSASTRSTPPRWMPEELCLLGRRPDEDLARLFGRTLQGIALKRSRLKIPHPNPKTHRWNQQDLDSLGRMSDADLAARMGVPERLVRGQRERLKRPVFNRRLHQWTPQDDAMLGQHTDRELALRWGVSVNAIKHRRSRLGIYLPDDLRRPKREQRPWTRAELALLGVVNDREIARRTGRWVHYVRWKREELGIATPFLKRWKAEEDAMLGRKPDEEIARLTGRSRMAVELRRQKLAKRKGVRSHQPRWRPAMDRVLGTAPDTVIARELGLPVLMVTGRRRFLKKPAWTPARITRRHGNPSP